MMFEQKPEILAPAGTLEGVEKVFAAGADAVYVGAKRFNMRMHRASYNLDDAELAEAIKLAHDCGGKFYLTMNNLLSEDETEEAGKFLEQVARLQPDAMIVQDFGMILLARERCAGIPLHASTMMNIHSTEAAQALKLLGITRVIPSRDIPLHEMRRIGEESGLEIETFVHGDICISQSAQCHLSGQIFGESANRGRCMKPCRWQWQLQGAVGKLLQSGEPKEGYLLARKDLCLLRHIPELVASRIMSFKIEGRMRTKEFLVKVVALYRQAVDVYFDDPLHYQTRMAAMAEVFAERVRDLTTSSAFGRPVADSVDLGGKREPRFFSEKGHKISLSSGYEAKAGEQVKGEMELVVHVNDLSQAQIALAQGADAVYFGSDGFRSLKKGIAPLALADFIAGLEEGKRAGILSPVITDDQGIKEWRWFLGKLAGLKKLVVGVSNIGALQVAREFRFRHILADYAFNLTNSVAVDEVSTLGATRVTGSIEISWAEMSGMVKASRLPLEIIGQGPLGGMLLEHCLIAASSGLSAQDVCSMPCRRDRFVLRDKGGLTYCLEPDRRCRSHIYLSGYVCVLPQLARLSQAGVEAVRIEAQFEHPEVVGKLVAGYREALKALAAGNDFSALAKAKVEEFAEITGREQTDGNFSFS